MQKIEVFTFHLDACLSAWSFLVTLWLREAKVLFFRADETPCHVASTQLQEQHSDEFVTLAAIGETVIIWAGALGRLGASKLTRDGLQIRLGMIGRGLLGSCSRRRPRERCEAVSVSLLVFPKTVQGCVGIRQTHFDHQNCSPSFDILCDFAALVVVVAVE